MATTKKNGRFFSRLFASKRFNMVFSLLFAFVFWLVIAIDQNPIRERTFTDVQLAISLKNTLVSKSELEIVSDVTTPKFAVTVSGPNYIVSSLTKDDFSLTVDLTDVTEASTYNLKVIPKRENGGKSDYEFLSVSPATVKISFDKITDKVFSIADKTLTVDVLGDETAVEGFVIDPEYQKHKAEKLIDSDAKMVETISLHGPEKTLESISKIVAFTQIDDPLEQTDSYKMTLRLLGENDKTLYSCVSNGKTYEIYKGTNTENAESVGADQLTVNTACVLIQIPVQRVETLPVVVKNKLGKVLDVTPVPATVSVRGEPAILDELDSNAAAVLIQENSAYGKKYQLKNLKLPSGVYLNEDARTDIIINH